MAGISRRRFLEGTAITSALLMMLGPQSALAAPSDEKRAEAAAVSEKLSAWQTQLDQDSDNYYIALDAHDAAVQAMQDAQGRIDTADAQIAELQDHLATRATAMYRNGNYTLVDVLLGSASFDDFVNTWSFLQGLNNDDQASIEQVQQVRQEAADARDEYARQEQVAADKLAEAENIQAEAQAIVDQYQAELDGLDAEIAALVQQEQEAAAAAAAAAAASASTSSSSAGSSSGDTGSSDSTSSGDDSSGGSTSDDSGGGSTYVPPSDGTVADIVVGAAYSQLGVPYVWGGEEPGVGLDCSGLVKYCYSCAGIYLPHYSQSQRSYGTRIPLYSAERGDILGNSHHVAIYIGDGEYIHAPDIGSVVQVGSNVDQFDDATRIG